MRIAAGASRAGLPTDWLNDGVKGFLGGRGEFSPFLELKHRRVMVAQPEYLLRRVNIDSIEQTVKIVTRFDPPERFPHQTLYALNELLPRK